jgi:hypothetical protein
LLCFSLMFTTVSSISALTTWVFRVLLLDLIG